METVLMVGEPNPEWRLAAAILRRHGFRVTMAWPPRAALPLCASNPPALVVAPAGLEDGAGRSFTAALRQMTAPHKPAVLCLATTLSEHHQEREQGEADTVLLRPVRARRLVEELNLLARRRPPRSEARPRADGLVGAAG